MRKFPIVLDFFKAKTKCTINYAKKPILIDQNKLHFNFRFEPTVDISIEYFLRGII